MFRGWQLANLHSRLGLFARPRARGSANRHGFNALACTRTFADFAKFRAHEHGYRNGSPFPLSALDQRRFGDLPIGPARAGHARWVPQFGRARRHGRGIGCALLWRDSAAVPKTSLATFPARVPRSPLEAAHNSLRGVLARLSICGWTSLTAQRRHRSPKLARCPPDRVVVLPAPIDLANLTGTRYHWTFTVYLWRVGLQSVTGSEEEKPDIHRSTKEAASGRMRETGSNGATPGVD